MEYNVNQADSSRKNAGKEIEEQPLEKPARSYSTQIELDTPNLCRIGSSWYVDIPLPFEATHENRALMTAVPDSDAPLPDWSAAIRADIKTNSGLSISSAKRAASGRAPLFAYAQMRGVGNWHDMCADVLLEWSAEPLRDRRGEIVRERDADEVRAQMWKARHIVNAAIRLGAPVQLGDEAMSCFLRPPHKPTRTSDDPEEIAEVVASWRPQRWRHGSLRNLESVLPDVRDRVLEANPADTDQARLWMRVLSGFALWAVWDRHSDPVTMHTPNNVETWVMTVNAAEDDDWKNKTRGVLRRLGPTVNPAAWPRPPKPLPARKVAAPYEPNDERAFRAAAGLPRRDRRARLWVAVAALGAGLNGPETAAAQYNDLAEHLDGRWAISVRGSRARLVPIRRDYLPLVPELLKMADSARFIASDKRGAADQIAQRILVDNDSLSLTRARNTFLASHIAAGTPPAALERIAGSVTHDTVTQLTRYVAADLSDEQALEQALGP